MIRLGLLNWSLSYNMKILYTCFNGKNNSSKILFDNIDGDKLY